MTTKQIVGKALIGLTEDIKSSAYLKYISTLNETDTSFKDLMNYYRKLDDVKFKKEKILKKMKYISRDLQNPNNYMGHSERIRLNGVYRGYQDKLIQYHNEIVNYNDEITKRLTRQYYE